jgi:8-oxo-dGTP pyrophosphatase MutT (NUDIX family)
MEDAEKFAERIGARISKGLPGAKSHSGMLPEGRLLVTSSSYTESAVLLLLYPKLDKWFTVFMKRNLYEGPHSGQISLPGGKKDVNDKSLLHTAIRETFEETGIDASNAIILPSLSPLPIPVSGFVVYPFAAVINYLPTFKPDKNEVEYLIEVSLLEMMDPSAKKTKTMLIRDKEVSVPYFDVQGEVIWGATAMITNEFLDLFKEIISD